MKLNNHAVATAMTIVIVGWYSICAAFCLLAPKLSFTMMAPLVHLRSLELFTPYLHITATSHLHGVVQYGLYSYATFYIAAAIYNRIVDR